MGVADRHLIGIGCDVSNIFCSIYHRVIIHCVSSDLTQVVDLGSTWKALSPKLSCETRPLVLKSVAELLSLVPSLHVKTEQYEVRLQFPSTPV